MRSSIEMNKVGSAMVKTAKATVGDVAKAAGVSVATVSRSFNIPKAVREDVRLRVIEIARQLGYSPNAAAKALRLQKTNIVGAIIPTLDYAIYAKMINAFQSTLSASGHTVLLLTAGFDNAHLYDQVRLVVERGAEALLIVGRIEDQRLRDFLQEKNLPVVCTYSYLDDPEFASIGFDNYAATFQGVDYLIRLGHRELVMLAGPTKGNDRQLARIRAFVDALRANGIDAPPRILESVGGFTLEFGVSAMRTIHAEHPEVTAVVCNSDVFAFGVLAECKKLGLRVPEDISVIGHDDLDFSVLMDPSLTTIAVPAIEMGQRSAQALLNALNKSMKVASLCLPTSLIVRASTAPPPQTAN